MRKYFWYLVRKHEVPNFSCANEWLLICPNFPDICISDAALNTDTYRNSEYISSARDLIEILIAPSKNAPEAILQNEDYLYFSIDFTKEELSSILMSGID